MELYVEAADENLKADMELVKQETEAINESKLNELGGSDFTKGKELFTLLLTKTSGDAEQLVKASPPDNGLEAWRRLHAFYDPTLAIQESEVSAGLTLMCRKPAKDVHELRKLLVEMESKRRRYEEVTGKAPDDAHLKSILAAILDTDTRKHTVIQQGISSSYEDLKRKVQEFVNAVSLCNPSSRGEIAAVVEGYSSTEEEPAWGTYEYPPGLSR